MDELTRQERAVNLLQELGLQEYEAKVFVALTRLPRGTAKEISQNSDVPRTRVYDAVRVLETRGLVEIQHSKPQQFRAVSIAEAAETLHQEFEERTRSLQETLDALEPVTTEIETDVTHEVWALSGSTGITTRTRELIDDADEELVFVLGDEAVFTDTLVDRLRTAQQRGVDVFIGTTTESIQRRVAEELPGAEVFVSGLEWLGVPDRMGDETEISRLVLVDETSILVSTFRTASANGGKHEQAVFGRGFDNGLVAITRHLMATGLAPEP